MKTVIINPLTWYGAHQQIQTLHDQKKEFNVVLDEGCLLPRIIGSHWKQEGREYYLKKDQDLLYGDWTMPYGKWNPQTYISVKHLATLPNSFLKQKVIVAANDQNENLFPYLTPKFRIKETEEEQILYFKNEYREAYLRGDEVVRRCPRSESFMISIAAWPIKYVPFNYLYWFCYDQRISRFENNNIWVESDYFEQNKSLALAKINKHIEKIFNNKRYTLVGKKGWDINWKLLPQEKIIKKLKVVERTLNAYGDLYANIKKYVDQAYWQDEEKRREIDQENEFNDFYGRGYWTSKSVLHPYSEDPTERVQEFIGSGTTFYDKWHGTGLNKLQTKQERTDDDPTPANWTLGLVDRVVWDQWTYHGRINENGWEPPNGVKGEKAPKTRTQAYNRTLKYLSWIDRCESLYQKVNDRQKTLNERDKQEEVQDRLEELDRWQLINYDFENFCFPKLEVEDADLIESFREKLLKVRKVLTGEKVSPKPKKVNLSTYLEKRKTFVIPDQLIVKILAEEGLRLLRGSGVKLKVKEPLAIDHIKRKKEEMNVYYSEIINKAG